MSVNSDSSDSNNPFDFSVLHNVLPSQNNDLPHDLQSHVPSPNNTSNDNLGIEHSSTEMNSGRSTVVPTYLGLPISLTMNTDSSISTLPSPTNNGNIAPSSSSLNLEDELPLSFHPQSDSSDDELPPLLNMDMARSQNQSVSRDHLAIAMSNMIPQDHRAYYADLVENHIQSSWRVNPDAASENNTNTEASHGTSSSTSPQWPDNLSVYSEEEDSLGSMPVLERNNNFDSDESSSASDSTVTTLPESQSNTYSSDTTNDNDFDMPLSHILPPVSDDIYPVPPQIQLVSDAFTSDMAFGTVDIDNGDTSVTYTPSDTNPNDSNELPSIRNPSSIPPPSSVPPVFSPQPSYPYFRRQVQERMTRPLLYRWAGDVVEGPHPRNILRLCLQNPNGLLTREYAKFHQISQSMRDHHINFMGLPESKVNPRHPSLLDLQTIHQSYHQCGLVHHTNTYVRNQPSHPHQPGGVSTLVDDKLANKFNGVEYDKYGRWMRVSILAKQHALRIYTLYRVNHQPTNCVNSSWHAQAAALAHDGIGTKPEIQVVTDIASEIAGELENNNHVIILADANEYITATRNSLHQALLSVGLKHILQQRFSDNLPPTHARGLQSIDHAWCSEGLLPFIQKAGIAPMNHIVTSDHRALIIDIDINEICRESLITLNPYDRRRLKSQIVSRANDYREFVSNQYEQQGVAKRINDLDKLLSENNTEEALVLNQSLDTQLCEIQLAGEKHLSAVHTDNWSPKYDASLKELERCRNQLAHYRSQDAILSPADLANAKNHAYAQLQEARANHKSNNENAAQLREQHQWDLAHHMVDKEQFQTAEAAFSSLTHIEQQRKAARIVRNALNPSIHSSLNYVLIPAKEEYPIHIQSQYKDPKVMWSRIEQKSGKDIKVWESISDREELEKMLIEWQCLHFQQAHDTPLATQKWETMLNDCSSIEELERYYNDEYEQLDEPTRAFIKELYETKPSVDEIAPTVTFEDFQDFIKDKKEKTSTSPSGRHLGHFKSTLDEPIFEAIFKVIQTALTLGQVPNRWKRTVTTLIEKEAGVPKIHRLRTIHIVEPEVQFISNFFWSRCFLNHCEKHADSHITDAQYGARRRRQAHSAIVKQLLIWDSTRMLNIPLVSHLADARANFDRNMYHLVCKALHSRQFPPEISQWYSTFLLSQLFHVRTSYGVSDETYTRTPMNRIYGDCQGLGWSAINQVIISSVIDEVYKKLSSQFILQDHDGKLTVDSGVGYFVDDRITNTMTTSSDKTSNLIKLAQRNEELQASLLNAAGGALAPTKCSVWVLERNDRLHLSYKNEKAHPGTLILKATSTSQPVDLERTPPSKSKRYLGAHINPTHSMAAQYSFLEEKITSWRTHVMQSNLTLDMIYHSYYSTLHPQLDFPLVASDLSENQCNVLMGKVRSVLTAKGHLHSKVKIEITHGPQELCGLNIPHLYDMQGQAKLRLLQIHAIKAQGQSDTIYNMLQLSLSHHCLWLGSFTNFLNESYEVKAHVLLQRTWLASLWKYLRSRELYVDLAEFPTYTLPRQNDQYLMDIIFKTDLSKTDKEIFNRIRVEERILSLSDIILDDGSTIHPSYLKGGDTFRDSSFNWPRKSIISKDWRVRFCEILRDYFVKYVKDHPLGKWTSKSHQYLSVHQLTSTTFRIKDDLFTKLVTGSYAMSYRKTTVSERKIIQPIEVKHSGTHGFRLLEYGDIGTVTEFRPLPTVSFPRPCVARIPNWMKTLWGKKITENKFTELIVKLQDPFIMVSDGGQPGGNGIGTYAYLLSTADGEIFYENYGIVLIASDQHASMRYEASGQLAGITLINFVELRAHERGIHLSNDRVYACDNESVTLIERDFTPPTNYHMKPHVDIVIQIRNELNSSPNSPEKITWVPSHQDDVKTWEEMTVLERLNKRADDLCDVAYHEEVRRHRNSHYKYEAPFLPAQKISIRNQNKRFVCEKPSEFHLDHTFESLQKVISDRDTLQEDTFDEIAWSTIATLFNSANTTRKLQIIKIVHEKWLTMSQKHKMDLHPDGACVLCTNTIETQKHVYQCKDGMAHAHRVAVNQTFYDTLLNIHTPEFIANYLVKSLDITKAWDHLVEIILSEPMSNDKVELALQAAQSQYSIGCHNLNKGFISTHWKGIITLYFSQRDVGKYTSDKWELDVVQALWVRSAKLWEHRNSRVVENDENYLSDLRQQATKDLAFYKKNQPLIGQYRFLLRYPPAYFLRANLATLLYWKNRLKDALKTTEEFSLKRQTLITKHFNPLSTTRKRKRPASTAAVFARRVNPRRSDAFFRCPPLETFNFTSSPAPRPPPAPDPNIYTQELLPDHLSVISETVESDDPTVSQLKSP